jgi:hypothetical protein
MAIEPVGPGHDGFYTRWVWVQVEIFTHGFAGMGPYEVAGWVRVMKLTTLYLPSLNNFDARINPHPGKRA